MADYPQKTDSSAQHIPGFKTNIWYQNDGKQEEEPSGYPVYDAPPPYQDTPEPQFTQTNRAEDHGEPPVQVMLRASSQNPPNDYMCFSIFNMLLCCLPFGIIALLKSHDVRARIAGRDWAMAEKMSRSTWNWNIAALVVGIIQYVIFIIVIACFFAVGPGSGNNLGGVGGGGGGGGGGGNTDYSWDG